MALQQHLRPPRGGPTSRALRACLLGTVGAACLAGLAAGARAQPRYQSQVRAQPNGAPSEDGAADASVITDDRTPRAGESVAQLLGELPGVTINRTGGIGALALVSLRGSTWEQVSVYLDGVPLNGAVAGGVDLSTLPLGDIERIEVYRGSSPIAFGSSALGGIIAITTRAPRVTRLDADLGAGSFDTYSAGVSGSWAGRRVRVYAGAHLLSTAGNFWFTSDNGTAFDTSHDHEVRRDNNAALQTDGTTRAVFTVGPGRELSLSALAFYRDQGLPGYGSVRQTRDTTLATLRLMTAAAYDSRRDLGNGGRLRAQLYYAFEQQRYHDPRAEVSIAPAATRDRTHTAGFSLRLSRPFASWLRGAAVAEGRYQVVAPHDALATPPDGAPATRLFGSAGAELDVGWQRAGLHLLPSLGVEVARDVRSGRDASAHPLGDAGAIVNVVPVARLGVIERIGDEVSLRANGGRYSRLPSLTELYGDSGFVIGSPSLRPESGWNADAGLRWHRERGRFAVSIELTGFASFVDDLIQFQQDAYGRAHALNIGRARILGAEAALDLRLGRWLRLTADTTFTDARDVSATSLGAHQPQLPNRPRLHVYARPEGRWPIGGALVLGAYADVDVIDGNYLDPANLVGLPARVLVGAGLYAEATRAHLQVVASAQNLGDVRSFDFAGFPLPSRSFFVSLRLTLPKENMP